MLDTNKKIIIKSNKPYIAQFNGMFATAKPIMGDITKRQGFDLTLPNNNTGRIFLNEDDYWTVWDNRCDKFAIF